MRAVRRAALGSSSVKAVALVAATYADPDGGSIRPGLATLMADTELSESTVRRAVDALEALGVLVEVTPSTPTSPAVYRMCGARLAELARPERARRARDRGVTVTPLSPRHPVSESPTGGVRVTDRGCHGDTLPASTTYQDPPDAREAAGSDMHPSGGQAPRAVPADDMAAKGRGAATLPSAQPDPEPVRLVDGHLLLSDRHRAYWLAPEMYAGDAVALDLALTQAVGAVQPRGPHSLQVQVDRQLARIAQQRRDQDRRYREARVASDGPAASRNRSLGAVPGDRPAPSAAVERDLAFTRSLTGTYGSEYETTRRYLPSTPEAQAYIARAERDGEPERDIARYRQKGVMLRPSEARRILAGAAIGSRPAATAADAVLARTAELRRAQHREPGRA